MSNLLDSRYRAMKKLPILLCIFLLSACAPSEVPSDKLVERNGIKYEINSQIPFTGVGVRYWDNGQLVAKQTYKDGKKHGLYEYYLTNGQLFTKGNYKDGKKHGLYETYYRNGQLESKSTYKDGKQNGLWDSYDENGQEENWSPMCFQNDKIVDISKCESP